MKPKTLAAAPLAPRGAWRFRLLLAAFACSFLLPSAAVAQAVLPGDEPNGPYPGWWSWPAIVQQLERWEQEYSHIMTTEVFGRTYEGRDMLVVKITQNPLRDDRGKPEVLFLSGIHSREQGPQVQMMQFIEDLLTGYGSDERITRLVDTRAIWVIPVYNVDGKVHDFQNGNGTTRGANWRTSRRPTGLRPGQRGSGPRPTYGIDLNRNGLVGWGGASDNPGTQTYHGEGPLSEPESQAWFTLMAARNFRIFVDVHSTANSFVIPPYLIREERERYRFLTNGMRERQTRPMRFWLRDVPEFGAEETEPGPRAATGPGYILDTGFFVHGAYSWVLELPGIGGGFYSSGENYLEHYRTETREHKLWLVEIADQLPLKYPGQVRMTGAELSGPLTPGSRVEWKPELEGEMAYGVLVTRDGRIRITGDLRLLPLTERGFTLNVAEDAEPGMEVPLLLYVWDRERRQTVIDVKVTIAAPDQP